MTSFRWFALGIIVAWTPSLILLAIMWWDSRKQEQDQ